MNKKKLEVRLWYTNGDVIIKRFYTKEDIHWFVHLEGDHLIDWEIINQ